ncbi:DUF6764 family protein [Rhodococcus aetherivorans]
MGPRRRRSRLRRRAHRGAGARGRALGGAGAGEARGGSLATLGFGEDALALGIVEEPATALVVAGPQSQAFIGDLRDPVLCEGSAATAVNLTTGRGCVVLGTFRYVTP